MDFLTTTVLSGLLYDMIKHGVTLSADAIKGRLKDWVINDIAATALSDEITKLDLNDDLSESAITKRLNQSTSLVDLMKGIKKKDNITTNIQNHSGSGDNVGGDKIIN